jgi:AcrR family transcriptional regulator
MTHDRTNPLATAHAASKRMNQKKAVEDRIVAAAVQLFARNGYRGTSTREIAKLAHVNEATVFRHFQRKIDLFGAALRSGVAKVRLGQELGNALSEDREPVVVLPLLFELLVTTAMYDRDFMRLLMFSVLELWPMAEGIFRNELGSLFTSVLTYLDRCAERGTIRRVDTFMALVAFATSVAGHQILYGLLTGNSLPYTNSQDAIVGYSSFWLAGLAPDGAADQLAAMTRPPHFQLTIPLSSKVHPSETAE